MNQLYDSISRIKMVKIVYKTIIHSIMNKSLIQGFATLALLLMAVLSFAQTTEREMNTIQIEPAVAINCTSEPVAIGVSVENWVPGTFYTWFDGVADSIRYVKPSQTSNYHLVVQNVAEGFVQDLTFTVTVKNAEMNSGAGVSTLKKNECIGSDLKLDALHGGGHSPFSYLWSNGATEKSTIVKGIASKDYQVTITDACGTEAISTVEINIEPRDPITAPEKQVEYFSCEGDEIMLQGSLNGVSGGVGHGYQYTFSDWDHQNEAFQTGAIEGMRVPVKITDACKSDITSVEILLKKAPIEVPDVSDLIVCKKDTIDIVQNVPAQVYFWTGSGYRTSENIVIEDDKSIELTYIDRCSDNHALERKIEARAPKAEFDYDLENSTGRVELTNLSDGEDLIYRWSVNGVAVSQEPSPELLLEPEKTSIVTLEIEDDHGCTMSATERIAAVRHMSFPSAFTPNGDSRNDFYSVCIEENLVSFKFEVFDRWGQLIYSTNDQYFKWDGRNGSSELPMSTYAYRAEGVTNAGETIEKFGTITIINDK